MIFKRTSTTNFWGEYRADGLNIYSEIDDDEMGFKSEIRFIIPSEALEKLFSVISEKDFFTLCKKDGLDGMLTFLDSHDIPYRKESMY